MYRDMKDENGNIKQFTKCPECNCDEIFHEYDCIMENNEVYRYYCCEGCDNFNWVETYTLSDVERVEL